MNKCAMFTAVFKLLNSKLTMQILPTIQEENDGVM